MARLLSTKTLQTRVGVAIATVRDVRFEPDADTLVAILSLFALWGIYYFQSVSDSVESLLLFLLVGNFGLTIVFPIYYACYVRDEPLSELGITTRGWRRAVVASTIAALVLLPGLIFVNEPAAVLIPHIVTVGLMIWEPFFVHGWLQIRFEQAFGAGPGIVLAGAAFALFHVGTTTLAGLLILLFFGAIHAALFRAFDRNLLVLWPILWAIGSSQGTLDSIVFGWEEATAYLGILLVTAVILFLTRKRFN
ncbi:hypothetical protein [Halostagnicola bangensis]